MATEMYRMFFEGQVLQAAQTTGQPRFYQNLEQNLDQLRSRKKLITLRHRRAEAFDFSSNDSLSLSSSGRLRQLFNEELATHPEFPVGSGGSRLLDGTNPYMEELEQDIADFHKAEKGLFFNSGYEANGAIFAALPTEEDAIVYDELVHASVHVGMRQGRAKVKIAFRHNDIKSFDETLLSLKASDKRFEAGDRTVLISIESIYSMDGDIAPISEFVQIAKHHFPLGNALLIVDEAHATGVVGPNGAGLVCELGLENEVAIRVHTFGKALATIGGIVLANNTIRTYLINFARPLIYSTSPSFPALAGIKSAYQLLKSGETRPLQENLQRLVRHFYTRLDDLHYWHKAVELGLINIPTAEDYENRRILTHIVPLITAENDSLAFHLHMNNFSAWPIEFPTVPRGTARVRLCFHAGNTIAEVDGLALAIVDWLKDRIRAEGKRQLIEDLEAELQARIALQGKKDTVVFTAQEVNGGYPTEEEYEHRGDFLMEKPVILQQA